MKFSLSVVVAVTAFANNVSVSVAAKRGPRAISSADEEAARAEAVARRMEGSMSTPMDGAKSDNNGASIFDNAAASAGSSNKTKTSGKSSKENGGSRSATADDCAFDVDMDESKPVSREVAVAITERDYCPCHLFHFVSFNFKDGANATLIEEATERVLSLKTTCLRDGEQYLDVVAGTPNSYEGQDQGHQLGFVMTFDSQGDRNFYVGAPLISEEDSDLYDPVHDAFKKWVSPYLDVENEMVPFVFVYDFCA